MKLYMIRGKKNGTYLAAGMQFSKNGKCWTSLGAFKSAIRLNPVFLGKQSPTSKYRSFPRFEDKEPEGFFIVEIDVDKGIVENHDAKSWALQFGLVGE